VVGEGIGVRPGPHRRHDPRGHRRRAGRRTSM